MPPKAKRGQGRAPQGFWREERAIQMLLSVAAASFPEAAISDLDFAYIAKVVGEGKLSEQSCRAKFAQLTGQGQQRIKDYEARVCAGDERTASAGGPHSPPDDDEDEVETGRRLNSSTATEKTRESSEDKHRRRKEKMERRKAREERRQRRAARHAARTRSQESTPATQSPPSVQDDTASRGPSPEEADEASDDGRDQRGSSSHMDVDETRSTVEKDASGDEPDRRQSSRQRHADYAQPSIEHGTSDDDAEEQAEPEDEAQAEAESEYEEEAEVESDDDDDEEEGQAEAEAQVEAEAQQETGVENEPEAEAESEDEEAQAGADEAQADDNPVQANADQDEEMAEEDLHPLQVLFKTDPDAQPQQVNPELQAELRGQGRSKEDAIDVDMIDSDSENQNRLPHVQTIYKLNPTAVGGIATVMAIPPLSCGFGSGSSAVVSAAPRSMPLRTMVTSASANPNGIIQKQPITTNANTDVHGTVQQQPMVASAGASANTIASTNTNAPVQRQPLAAANPNTNMLSHKPRPRPHQIVAAAQAKAKAAKATAKPPAKPPAEPPANGNGVAKPQPKKKGASHKIYPRQVLERTRPWQAPVQWEMSVSPSFAGNEEVPAVRPR